MCCQERQRITVILFRNCLSDISVQLTQQIPIYWAKPSIPHSTMKEHPDIVKFCHFSAYVRTRSAGILRGLTPWHTDFGTKSSVLHLVRGVQAPGTHVRSDYSQTRHIGGRPSSHKANLIPQSKRQDTIAMMIPCLCFLRMALTYIVPVRYCMNRGSANGAPAGGAFLVDIPEDWEPRAKQQPTGLIAYGTSCRRPVRVLYRPALT